MSSCAGDLESNSRCFVIFSRVVYPSHQRGIPIALEKLVPPVLLLVLTEEQVRARLMRAIAPGVIRLDQYRLLHLRQPLITSSLQGPVLSNLQSVASIACLYPRLILGWGSFWVRTIQCCLFRPSRISHRTSALRQSLGSGRTNLP